MLDVEKDHTNFSMKLGVEFESDDDAIEYYNSYAEATGFKIRKEYVNKNKVHGYVTSRKITCCKEGLQTTYNRGPWAKRPRRETRTGCLAHIIVTRQENGKYRVTQFEEAHNHPLSPPNQKRVSRFGLYNLTISFRVIYLNIFPKQGLEFLTCLYAAEFLALFLQHYC